MKEAHKLAELAPKIMNAFHDLGRQHPEKSKLSMRQEDRTLFVDYFEKIWDLIVKYDLHTKKQG